jgi:hypothetical protein
MIIGVVWRAGVFIGAGIVAMGPVRVTTLHPQGWGDPDLPLAPEAVPSSSKDSLRAVRRDGDPL